MLVCSILIPTQKVLLQITKYTEADVEVQSLRHEWEGNQLKQNPTNHAKKACDPLSVLYETAHRCFPPNPDTKPH